MAAAKMTTDHDFIRKWAEERGGHPAHVKSVARKGEIGILRIDFPSPPDPDDERDANLEEISWDDFFEKFEREKLAFLYQEEREGGGQSNFNKIISRESAKTR